MENVIEKLTAEKKFVELNHFSKGWGNRIFQEGIQKKKKTVGVSVSN